MVAKLAVMDWIECKEANLYQMDEDKEENLDDINRVAKWLKCRTNMKLSCTQMQL